MNLIKEQAIIEAMLFSTGREIKVKEIMNALEIGSEDIEKIMQNMKLKYDTEDSDFFKSFLTFPPILCYNIYVSIFK